MKKEKRKEVRIVITILLIVFFFAYVMARPIAIYVYDTNLVCKQKYGEDWFFLQHSVIDEICVRYNMTDLNIEEYAYYPESNSEKRELCEVPKFFDITKWSSKCD